MCVDEVEQRWWKYLGWMRGRKELCVVGNKDKEESKGKQRKEQKREMELVSGRG